MTDPQRSCDAVVVGCGVIGMTTALALRAAGRRVEVWTRDDPMRTTSAAAGAIWYPYLAEPRDRVLAWSVATYRRLAELAERPGTGVAMREVVEVFAGDVPDLWWRTAVPDVQLLARDEVPAPYAAAVRVRVPVCDVPRHLSWLLAELDRRGVVVVRRAVDRLRDAFASARLVVNCTGLGARQLCGDRELQAVRGQVEVYSGAGVVAAGLDVAWIDDTDERPRYLIPRGDSVVVGGTAQRGDERCEPDAADTRVILAGVADRIGSIGDDERRTQVGLRPYRSTVRLEREPVADGGTLVHNYGHGGSGYTLAWGCADEVVRLAGGTTG